MTELERAVEAYIENPANYLEYQDGWEDLSDLEYVEKAFKAGANWRYEQFEKERLKHCDELTAEQAQMESDFVVQHLKNFNRTPTFIDAIEYGRESMREKLIKLKKLADNMYYAAQYLTTDASKLHEAMKQYRYFTIYELKKIEQESAWSEEDEEMTDDVIKGCVSAEKAHHFLHTPKEVADWLKSIKDRMQGKEE